MKLSTLGILAAAVTGALLAGSAQAASIEITNTTVVGPVAGVFDYQYTMTLTGGDSISATNPNGNSLFTFFDVGGLVAPIASFTAGATASADWQIFNELTTPVWAGGLSTLSSQGGIAVEPDSPTAPNLRFQYVGTGFTTVVNVVLGVAHIFSNEAPGTFINYDARWVDNASGRTQVNTDTPLGPAAIPVPAAAWAGLSTLSGLGALGLLRKRRN